MKRNGNYMLREIAGCFVVVPVGDSSESPAGMFFVNDTGALLWKTLEEDKDVSQLIEIVLQEYEIDHETAKRDVIEFVNKLNEIQALSKT